MKRKLIALACSAMMMFGFGATASAAAGDLGYVNWQVVVANYPGIQDVVKDIAQEKAQKQQQFDKQSKNMDDKAKIELANKLNAEAAQFEQGKLAPINQDIRATILAVAKKHAIESVVNANAVIVGGTDLTQEVIDSLKSKK